MKYTTTAYDPEIWAPRVSGSGDTAEKSIISCLKHLCDYLQNTPRWAGQPGFRFTTKEN